MSNDEPPAYRDTEKVLATLTEPMVWCVDTYELEMGDEAMIYEGLVEAYDEIERVDLGERAAELLETDEDGEDVHEYDDRREFLSMVGELPEGRSDEDLKAKLREMAS